METMCQHVGRDGSAAIRTESVQELVSYCMQDTFARATHAAGRPSAARDDRVSCIQVSCIQGIVLHGNKKSGFVVVTSGASERRNGQSLSVASVDGGGEIQGVGRTPIDPNLNFRRRW